MLTIIVISLWNGESMVKIHDQSRRWRNITVLVIVLVVGVVSSIIMPEVSPIGREVLTIMVISLWNGESMVKIHDQSRSWRNITVLVIVLVVGVVSSIVMPEVSPIGREVLTIMVIPPC